MNTKSIRFRVSVWYTSIFACAMAVLFVSFYFLTQQSLLSHTDSAITSHTAGIIEIIGREEGNYMESALLNNSQAFAHQFTEMPGMVLIIGDPFGKILYSSQSLGNNQSVAEELLEKSANIIKPAFVNRYVGSSTVRLGVFPAERNNGEKILVIMGQPMDVIQNSLNTLAVTLAAVYAGVFLLSLVGGTLLAGKAMNPVAAMSHKLKEISAENLDERIPNPMTGDELEELSRTFNGLLDHLHDAFVRERQFIGDMAHELKTPLATLRSSIEVTLEKPRTIVEYKQAFADTLVDVNRLSQTVKNILDLAWIGADHAHISKDTIDLSRVCEDLHEIAEKLAVGKKISISAQIASDIYIEGMEDKIFRALLNIVDNAVKYTPSGKRIHISLKKEGENALVVIKDSGKGISTEEQQHIFERFYRGQKTGHIPGSGLGLAIAHGIVSAHHGTIQVVSKSGSGTTMTVIIPLATAAS